MLKLAQKLAALKGTHIIDGAYKLRDDGTIQFVLGAGPKLTMSEAELRSAIAELEAKTAPTVIDPTDGIDKTEAAAAGAALRARRTRKNQA